LGDPVAKRGPSGLSISDQTVIEKKNLFALNRLLILSVKAIMYRSLIVSKKIASNFHAAGRSLQAAQRTMGATAKESISLFEIGLFFESLAMHLKQV